MEKIEKTEQEWRDELTPEQYEILRKKGTERPFTGRYVDTKADGTYCCAACGNELFGADTKFDSGTGWPSFFEPADNDAVETATRQQHVHAAHRGRMRPLRLSPRPRLRRRPGADRPAILHQLLCPRTRLRGPTKLLTRRGNEGPVWERRTALLPAGIRASAELRRSAVLDEDRRDRDRAVGLLAILDDRDQRPADRHGGAVERVDVLRRCTRGGPVAAAETTSLVVGRVRGRGQLAVSLLARDPGLAVELAGRRGAEVADRDVDDAVGNLERARGSAPRSRAGVRARPWPPPARRTRTSRPCRTGGPERFRGCPCRRRRPRGGSRSRSPRSAAAALPAR